MFVNNDADLLCLDKMVVVFEKLRIIYLCCFENDDGWEIIVGNDNGKLAEYRYYWRMK